MFTNCVHIFLFYFYRYECVLTIFYISVILHSLIQNICLNEPINQTQENAKKSMDFEYEIIAEQRQRQKTS